LEKSLITVFSVRANYDDNVYLSGLRREKDLMTALEGRIKLSYLSENTRVSLDYEIAPEFYQKETRLNNTRHRGTLSFDSQLTPWLKAGLTDTLIITEDVDRNLYDRGVRYRSTTSRTRKQTNRLSMFLEPQLSSRISVRADFSRAITDVGRTDEADEEQNSMGISLNYITDTERNDIASLNYRFTDYNYESNGDRIREYNDFETHSVYLSYIHHFTPSLSATIHAGMSHRPSDSSDDDRGTSFKGGINVSKKWSQAQLTIGYERDIGSGGGRATSVTYQTVHTIFEYELSPYLSWSINSSYSYNDYQHNNRYDSSGDTSFWQATLALQYQPFQWWSIEAGYHYATRDEDRRRTYMGGGSRREVYQSPHITTTINLGKYWQLSLGYTYSRNSSSGRQYPEDDYDRNQVWFRCSLVLPWNI